MEIQRGNVRVTGEDGWKINEEQKHNNENKKKP